MTYPQSIGSENKEATPPEEGVNNIRLLISNTSVLTLKKTSSYLSYTSLKPFPRRE